MVKIFGEAEEGAVEQIERCIEPEEGALGVLCADNHVGYSQPIGGVVAYQDHISPSGVGYDIACGNAAAKTSIRAEDVNISNVLDEIEKRISFGVGRSRKQAGGDDAVIDQISQASLPEQRALADLAASQLGTVGSGNHYVDLFEDEAGFLWVGVHFGSRGFGHKTASGFLSLANGGSFNDKVPGGEMHSPPVLIPVDSYLGQAYIEAMTLAGNYAYAGRNTVVSEVLDILQASPVEYVHNHHNFAWLEEHDGRKLWVVRKGATPAGPGVRGFVGGSMGEISVILEGVDTDDNREGLFSTVHGAGRVMSRSQAKGKIKRHKRWECTDRDCAYSVPAREFKPKGKNPTKCPRHPDRKFRKVETQEQIRPGLIDWKEVKTDLTNKGIDIRGGGADEAPGAYKRLPEVLAAHGDTIKILHTLNPLGVVMAGSDVFDPYKD